MIYITVRFVNDINLKSVVVRFPHFKALYGWKEKFDKDILMHRDEMLAFRYMIDHK